LKIKLEGMYCGPVVFPVVTDKIVKNNLSTSQGSAQIILRKRCTENWGD
jgi:hypothetical protein